MERTKRMLVVMLASFGIFALLTFLTFSSYGQTVIDTDDTDHTVNIQHEGDSIDSIDDTVESNLVGVWETEYNGETNYFTFNEDNSLIIRSDIFSNSIANPNDKQVGEMSYKIDSNKNPHQLTIYHGDEVIEGVFSIADKERITVCLNMEDNDNQPTEISDDYLILTLYRVEK